MGTDFPVEPSNPWRNIDAALHRRNELMESWHPQECLDWNWVLEYYTNAPARAARWMNLGRLMPGYEASLVVVDKDPAAEPCTSKTVKMTMLRGNVVYHDGNLTIP